MLPRSVTPAPQDAAASGALGTLAVSRIWPRAQGRLSLELVTPGGDLLAGQWFADDGDRARIARDTRARAAHPGHVHLSPAYNARGDDVGLVLVQAGGADRRLRALPRHLAEPGTTLLVHRPERRAVVHRLPSGEAVHDDDGDAAGAAAAPGLGVLPGVRAGGEYLRILRPGRTTEVVRVAQLATELLAHLPVFTTPTVRAHLADEGVVITSAVPGRSIREAGAAGHPSAVVGAAGTGRLLRELSRLRPPVGLPHRDADAELAWLQTWLTRVHHHLPHVHARLAPALEEVAGQLRRTTAAAPGVVHGDLHDGQILVDDDGRLGVLDWDTLATGEGALDAANVWAHTDLRRLLRQWPAEHAEAAWSAVVESWVPDDRELARAGAYRRLILLRLACQYAFRPAQEHVVDTLAELATAP